MYWKALFDPENLKDVVFKLNGEAELFYRRKVIENAIFHKKDSFVVNKTRKLADGRIETIPDAVHQELYNHANHPNAPLSPEAEKLQNTVSPKQLTHEIVKDRRYTEDKFLFHVPLTINFKSPKKCPFNEMVREYLQRHPETPVIGIDRGERNLLYYSVIEKDGKIKEQGSLNTIDGVDYQGKLDLREQERDEARKSWKSIGGIKDLKSGYLSLAVRKIIDLMLKYQAIVVLEDLNIGFKRGRFKVEKQIYQNFEIALIEKLNYLVLKEQSPALPGGVLKGYQLTPKMESYQKISMAKQSGFLFYVPAGYTSKIDPATGFVNLFRLNDLTNMEKRQNFFAKFEEILFDGSDFQFTFDYSKFAVSQSDFVNRWSVSSRGSRIGYSPSSKESFEIKPTDELKKAFMTAGVDFPEGKNLAETLKQLPLNQTNESFFKKLLAVFSFILQMRNSKSRSTAREDDYILSPVADKDGHYFDSRTAASDMPQDADANGAYHIALKGRMLIEALAKDTKAPLTVKTADYLKFVQERHQ